jgi:hypothetical protein
VEKEAYPIIEALIRLKHFLLREKGFKIFTDHRNLVYILDPKARASETRRHVNDRLERWATKMLTYRYEISHISGEDNVWADLLSRWARPTSAASAAAMKGGGWNPRIRPLQNQQFEWPTIKEITDMQERSRQIPDKAVKVEDGMRVTEESQIWIPTKELQLRICVIAHSGCAGHRGVEPTTEAIAKNSGGQI